eukprot:g18808.t1
MLEVSSTRASGTGRTYTEKPSGYLFTPSVCGDEMGEDFDDLSGARRAVGSATRSDCSCQCITSADLRSSSDEEEEEVNANAKNPFSSAGPAHQSYQSVEHSQELPGENKNLQKLPPAELVSYLRKYLLHGYAQKLHDARISTVKQLQGTLVQQLAARVSALEEENVCLKNTILSGKESGGLNNKVFRGSINKECVLNTMLVGPAMDAGTSKDTADVVSEEEYLLLKVDVEKENQRSSDSGSEYPVSEVSPDDEWRRSDSQASQLESDEEVFDRPFVAFRGADGQFPPPPAREAPLIPLPAPLPSPVQIASFIEDMISLLQLEASLAVPAYIYLVRLRAAAYLHR